MRLVLAGGGTGGHFFPCLAVIQKLIDAGHEVLYLGSVNGIEARKRNLIPVECVLLNVKGVRGKGFKGILNGALLLEACRRAINVIRNFKPGRLVLFGGYASLPLGLSGALLKVPTLLHEQNSVPGKTNLFLSRFAKKVMVAYRSAEKFFSNTAFTGVPVREEVLKARRDKALLREHILRIVGFSPGKKTLLVLGGSQGALWINETLKKAVKHLKEVADKVQVVHISGEGKSAGLEEAYKKAGITAVVLPFYAKVWELYALADAVVSRAGAVAVAEIALFGIPALFIPYPFAVDDHQYSNVKDIEKAKGCLLHRQEELTPQALATAVKSLLFDIMLAKRLSENIKKFAVPDATERVVREILHG